MAGLQADRDIVAGLAEAKHDEFELEKKGLAHSETSHDQELDGIHDGLEFPTDEEKATLRRVSDSIPWNAYRMSASLHVLIGRSPLILAFPQSLLSSSFANGSPTTERQSSL